ncbi:MAG: nucleotidyltransferase substrate binding protein [Candidatus Magnetoovum sp. WYHC-5]|nr:nucleotidyltransferase substrate binding protein [Candidatus Magnetoovum sp. WYHC-5]
MKKDQLKKALITLFEVISIIKRQEQCDDIIRDSLIKRFEYTSELFWKTMKEYLYNEHAIEAHSPKNVMRECRNINLFSEEETKYAIEILEARNEAAHAYHEKKANEIAHKIPKYAEFIQEITNRINSFVG